MTIHKAANLATSAGEASGLRVLEAALLLGTVFVGWMPTAISADDFVDEPRPAHWYAPAGAAGPLIAYDLEAECAENARKRDARQVFNSSCFTLQQFMDTYHPGVDFTWRRFAHRDAGYLGTRRRDDGILQEVFIRWQSLSDGLQVGFSESELTRHAGTDPFAIVVDATARDRIRATIAAVAAGGPYDVFAQRTRTVIADERTEVLALPPAGFTGNRYGVFSHGRVRYFTPAGDPLDDNRRP